MKRNYTCLPDYDTSERKLVAAYHRDRRLSKVLSKFGAAGKMPAKHLLDTSSWEVHDQETEKSCVGYAVSTAREHYEFKTGNKVSLSPLFIYWWARQLDNVSFQDGGSRIINALRCLKMYGVCEEKYHKSIPGTTSDVFVTPDTAAMASAKKFMIVKYSSVQDIVRLKEALVEGHPVVAGIPVYSSIESEPVEKSGVISMPAPGETLLGGHAIVFVGYDDSTKLFKFHNSWGPKWGDGGYGYVPYSYLESNYFDAWEMQMS